MPIKYHKIYDLLFRLTRLSQRHATAAAGGENGARRFTPSAIMILLPNVSRVGEHPATHFATHFLAICSICFIFPVVAFFALLCGTKNLVSLKFIVQNFKTRTRGSIIDGPTLDRTLLIQSTAEKSSCSWVMLVIKSTLTPLNSKPFSIVLILNNFRFDLCGF